MTNGVQRKQTPKPNLLQISTNYANGAFCSLVKLNLPKVNLTPIFCNQTKEHKPHTTIAYSPLATDGGFYFDTNLDVNNIPVQKSNSAPTLPHTPSPHSTSSLSPRFAKQAAIYKKRSRHLSDRSDRSSLGSDEPLSDDELESGGMFSPATSPLKQRVGVIGGHLSRLNAYFNRAPLLGNLEETLLQRRLMPTVEVHGFKVLLGASGGFCPMQLTIPAMAYFYELPGDSLSTPYVCEVRLPRKGYSVPRMGTVQVTLLNPAGTVVRMFVVPYDMRDMPPLHQTFIRQRILADTTVESSSCNIDTVAVQRRDEFKNDNNNNYNNNTFINNFNNNNNNNNSDNSCCNGNSSAQKCESASGDGNNNNNNNLGHFISVEHMKRLRYSIHLRFQTSRSGRLSLHTDIRALICRRTDCDTAAAHAKGVFETPSDLITDTVMPNNPKYCSRPDNTASKI